MLRPICSLSVCVAVVAAVGAFGRDPRSGQTTEFAVSAPVAPPAKPLNLLPVRGGIREPSSVIPSDFVRSPRIEVYGNFHTIGVIATLTEDITADRVGRMRCFINHAGQWQPQHDLVQVGSFPWFATSIFWLKPASTYQFKVEVLDPRDQILATWFGQGMTRREPVLHKSDKNLFVATDGDDSNSGTIDRPFRTLAHGFETLQAGQTLFIRGGTYHEGMLAFSANGREGMPIVVRAYPGEQVILDGTDPDLMDAATWRSEGEGVFSHPCEGTVHSVTLRHKSDGKAVRLFPVLEWEHLKTKSIPGAGEFRELGIEGAIFASGDRIYVYAPQPLDHYNVHVSGQNRGIVIENRGHIQIDGLEINHYGQGDSSTAIMIHGSPDILIQNCRFGFDDSHIYVKLDADRLTIQDCLFVDAIGEWPFSYMKGGSGISGRFEGGAVNVDAKFHGRGLVFRRNRIENLFDGVHLTPWTVNSARTNEIDCYENHIDGCIDDFIEADGFSRNVRIFNNYLNRSLSGISLAQALDGPTFLIYNVIANCGMVPAAQRTNEQNHGYPFKTNGGPGSDIGSGPLFFYHNTAHTLDPHGRAMLVKRPKWKKITFRNNIWAGKILGFELWHTDPSPMDFDYDNLHVAKPDAPLVLQAYRTQVMTLEEVRERYGWLNNGISADPRLVNVAEGDYSLADTSPCIDAGVLVPGINDLFWKGAAPDMGAYESR